MKCDFFIPEKIKVGFQKRSDTYTGNLGYVIYYDNKGTLRKETSWDGWRDKSIPPMDFNNIPISGFMLNRHAGGDRCGWNHRQSYCRVWDPRGFEFEITIDNLLWILEYCDCTKGKTLEGNFVYSWLGKDLVLLPEITDEYKNCLDISRKRVKKRLKTEDLCQGGLYKLKSGVIKSIGVYEKPEDEFVFIGKVKSQIGPDAKPENIHLFSNKSLTWFFSLDLGRIDYEVCNNFIEQEQVDIILHRFNISAYSWNFWNTKEGFILKLDYVKNIKKKCGGSSSIISGINNIDYEAKQLGLSYSVISSEDGLEFDYYQPYYYVKVRCNNYSGYYKYYTCNVDLNRDFLSKRFKLEGGVIKKEKDFLNIGKINKSFLKSINTRYGRVINEMFSMKEVYPDFEKNEDILKKQSEFIVNNNGFKGEKKQLVYTTVDGYVSTSLQFVLSRGAGYDGLFDKIYSFELPEKI